MKHRAYTCVRVKTNPLDVQAADEGRAIARLETHRIGSHVTSSIAWAPKKPGGTKGWIKCRRMRAAMVRGKSNRTPKLEASYVRAFGQPGR